MCYVNARTTASNVANVTMFTGIALHQHVGQLRCMTIEKGANLMIVGLRP